MIKHIPRAERDCDRYLSDSRQVLEEALITTLPPASKSYYCTNVGALAGSAVSRTLDYRTTMLEVGDLSKPIVLNWHSSFKGKSDTFGSCTDTFAETLASANYDILVFGGIQSLFFAVPDGAVAYSYDNVGSAGTPIIIEH